MKKILATALVLGAISPLAFAGGTGLYVGGKLAYNNTSMTTEDTDCYNECSAYTLRPAGGAFGLQVGQNFNSGSLLYGWSLNDDIGSQKQSITYGSLDYNSQSPTSSRATIQSKLKSVMSLRFKAGLQVNDTAVVASFGPARGDFEQSFDYSSNATTTTHDVGGISGKISGTVMGLSLEHNCSDQLMVSLDFSSYTFKNKIAVINTPGNPASQAQINFVNSLSQVAVTANFRF
jgi:hypothetical protein